MTNRSVCKLLPPGTSVWQRLFTRLPRLSVSGPPQQGHSFQPAASALKPIFPKPGPPPAPPPSGGLPPPGSRAHRRRPVASFKPASSGYAVTPAPLWGFAPSRSTRRPFCNRKAHLPKKPDCPSLPAAETIGIGRHGSSFQARRDAFLTALFINDVYHEQGWCSLVSWWNAAATVHCG
jgi:hypothetical protein